jgi:hypothetical protein
MQKHQDRLLLIAICLCVTVLALVGGLVLGIANDKAIAALVTAMGLLVPALVDATLVEKRRIQPHQKAVVDDVTADDPLRS